MNSYPYDIVCLDLGSADLITFDFSDSQLTFRLPEKTENKHNYLAPLNISEIAEDQWSSGARDHFRSTELACQIWYHLDAFDERRKLISTLYLSLLQLSSVEAQQDMVLSKSVFPEWLLANLQNNARKSAENPEELSSALEDWQVPKSINDIERIPKPHLDWLVATGGHTSMGDPEPTAYIPISHQYVLFVTLDTGELILSEADRRVPVDEMKRWNRQLFHEFLDHMTLTYSPEALDTIHKLE